MNLLRGFASITINECSSEPEPTIPVEEIVSDTKLTYAQRLSEAKEEVSKSLFSAELPQVRNIGEISKEISHPLLQRREDVRDRMDDAFKIVEYFVGSSDTSSRNYLVSSRYDGMILFYRRLHTGVKDLLVNNNKDNKRWNDNTKSLFAISFDYGGQRCSKS